MNGVGIVGAGAWGTALAQTAARAGRDVLLFARDPEVASRIERDRSNPRRLEDIVLLPSIRATSRLDALNGVDVLLLTVPAQTVRTMAASLPGRAPVVVCAKGFDEASGTRLSEVVGAVCPGRATAALSGPNFAREVALGLPAATTLGVADEVLGQGIAEALSSAAFRVYWTDDVAGVEIGGTVKNVLALAAGIVMGLGLGENARAGLLTRGLAELTRLGQALGARPETLAGLAGLGDLILTGTSLTSRNTSLGFALGRGADPAALAASGPLCEGVHSTPATARLGERLGIDLPIVTTVDDLLAGRCRLDEVVERLMRRPLRPEA
jgi:glycerol-3-phosphate dehydrogenase (NAD(P)+)